jgi:hypothetical protein
MIQWDAAVQHQNPALSISRSPNLPVFAGECEYPANRGLARVCGRLKNRARDSFGAPDNLRLKGCKAVLIRVFWPA